MLSNLLDRRDARRESPVRLHFQPVHELVQVIRGADGNVTDTKVVPDSAELTVDPKVEVGIGRNG